MKVELNNKPEFDSKNSVADAFKSTFLSTPTRRKITAIILVCQFILPAILDMITLDDKTYKSMAESNQNASFFHFCIGLVKYFLLISVIIKSPPKTSFKRTGFSVMILGGFLWFYFCADFMSSVFSDDEFKSKLAAKSFQENKKEIYAKVVFAAYEEDTLIGKMSWPVVRERTAHMDGFILIVQVDQSIYRYKALDEICSNFNGFLQYGKHHRMIYGMSERNPDLPSCLYFWMRNYYKHPPTLPAIPQPNHYVKVLFDPIEHNYELFTDSSTLITPRWDSMPTS